MKGKIKDHNAVSSEIIRASKSIKKKHLALKLGRSEHETLLAKHFKPITEPLKKVMQEFTIKQEVKEEKDDDDDYRQKEFASAVKRTPIRVEKSASRLPRIQKTPAAATTSTPATITTIPATAAAAAASQSEEVLEYDPSTSQERERINAEMSFDQFRNEYQNLSTHQPDIVDTFLEQYDMLPRMYLDGLLSDTRGEYDLTTGVHFDHITNQHKLGKSVFEFNGPDIVIDNIRYKGTAGLYELIFKSHPHGYTKDDERRYQAILIQTHVHHRNYDPKQQVKGSKSFKYINVIRPLTYQRHSSASGRIEGRGHIGDELLVKNEPYQYVYWDDVNELVDRLRLLMASTTAGHTGHDNEIASIIEELREAEIIQ